VKKKEVHDAINLTLLSNMAILTTEDSYLISYFRLERVEMLANDAKISVKITNKAC